MRFASLLALLLAASSGSAQVICTNGSATLSGVTYACDGIDLLANIPTGTTGPLRARELNDIWGWTDPQDGKDYAIVGANDRTVFVDVSSPTAPRVLGTLPATGGASTTWRDIKVYQNHAFVVADRSSRQVPLPPDHGMQVFDLTRLRGLTADPDRVFDNDALYSEFSSAHNIVINEATGFAYAVGVESTGTGLPSTCNPKGFHAIDISTPTNPVFAACFSNAAQDATFVISPGYTHDAQCVVYSGPDSDYTDKELCFAANEDEVTVFDVANKNAVSIISQVEYPSDAYTHQGWLTEDHRYFLVNDELDEFRGLVSTQRTMVFDMEDLDNPEFLFIYDSGITTIDHNLYTLDGFAYQANYEAGLRIIDLSNIENSTLTEAAFFDTYPQATTTSFNGMWSVYPYFASGNLIASDSNNGLFVLRAQANVLSGDSTIPISDAFALSPPQPNPATGHATLTLQVFETQTVSARLYDLTGRELALLYSGTLAAQQALPLAVDASALPIGVYVVRVTGETFSTSERLTVVR